MVYSVLKNLIKTYHIYKQFITSFIWIWAVILTRSFTGLHLFLSQISASPIERCVGKFESFKFPIQNFVLCLLSSDGELKFMLQSKQRNIVSAAMTVKFS